MSLKEQTLFGKVDKVEIAISRLKEFEPPENYYLAFSGGKDSITIFELAKMAGVKFDAHYNITTVDPPELVHFIKRNYPTVERVHPKKTMWQLIPEHSMPPTRVVRYCCDYLKERDSGSGRIVVTGIRRQESLKRSGRKVIENCIKNKTRTFLNPIVDWAEDEVWEFIRVRNLDYCSLYDEGYKRIGCIMCPMSGTEGMLKDAKRWPKYYKAYIHTFDKMLNMRNTKGLKNDTWKTGQDVMDWWIYGQGTTKINPDQTVIFEQT